VFKVGLFGWYSVPDEFVVKSPDEQKKAKETQATNKKAKKHEQRNH
jgi:hypothetical protein